MATRRAAAQTADYSEVSSNPHGGKDAKVMEYSKLSCDDYVKLLSSDTPVPGGGSAAALIGAIGTALGNMVGSLTLGREKYANVQDYIIAFKAKADALQNELMLLMQKDADVFEPLSKAYGMPRSTEEEKAEKARVMAVALKECCEVSLHIMRSCCEAINLHGDFAAKGTAIAISDVGCGVACCKAALQAASLNVAINTKSMADRTLAERYNKEAADILTLYSAKADWIFAEVASRFN